MLGEVARHRARGSVLCWTLRAQVTLLMHNACAHVCRCVLCGSAGYACDDLHISIATQTTVCNSAGQHSVAGLTGGISLL